MKLGICTGGGDCPGLNAVIRAVVKHAVGSYKMEVIGVEHSLNGLITDPMRIRKMSFAEVSTILDRGGTILGTSSRGDIFEDINDPRVNQVIAGYKKAGLDALIVVGGEGTQALAKLLSEQGLNIIGVPKTIDNDLPGTERTVGFSTAAEVATDAIIRLQSTAESHDRVMILEVMGRDSGYLALNSGIAGNANVILIPEIPFSIDAIVRKIDDRKRLGRKFSVIVTAEGALPIGGAQSYADVGKSQVRLGGIGQFLAHELPKHTDCETRVTVLGHVQRGGTPNPEDRLLGTHFGTAAVDLAHQKKFGCFVAIQNGQLGTVPYSNISSYARRKLSVDDPWIKTAENIGICMGRPMKFHME